MSRLFDVSFICKSLSKGNLLTNQKKSEKKRLEGGLGFSAHRPPILRLKPSLTLTPKPALRERGYRLRRIAAGRATARLEHSKLAPELPCVSINPHSTPKAKTNPKPLYLARVERQGEIGGMVQPMTVVNDAARAAAAGSSNPCSRRTTWK